MKMHKNKPMPTRDTLIITRERRPYITKGMVFHYLQVSVLGVGNGNSSRQSPWSGEGEQCRPVPLELVIKYRGGGGRNVSTPSLSQMQSPVGASVYHKAALSDLTALKLSDTFKALFPGNEVEQCK